MTTLTSKPSISSSRAVRDSVLLDQARRGMGARIRIRHLPSSRKGIKLLKDILGETPHIRKSYHVTINSETHEPLLKMTRRHQQRRKLVVVDRITTDYIITLGSKRRSKSRQRLNSTLTCRVMPTEEQTRDTARSLASQLGHNTVLLSNEKTKAEGYLDAESITVKPLPNLGVIIVSGNVQIEELNQLDAGWVVPSSVLRFDMPKIRIGGRKLEDSWHAKAVSSFGHKLGEKLPVWIGFVDSGLDPCVASREFQGRSLLFSEFRGDKGPTLGQIRESRLDAHGTKMACLAASSTHGACPDANLILASCFYDGDAPATIAVLNALDWVMERLREQEGVKVLNLSFNVHDIQGKAAADELFRPALRNCLEDSIIVVGSIGNSGPGNPGSPGDYREVLGVGAFDQQLNLYTRCSHGYVTNGEQNTTPYYKPDFIAPGVDLLTMGRKCKLGEVTGTSASSAVLAGLVGEILRNFLTLPTTHDDLRIAIQSRGAAVRIGQKPHDGKCYLIPSQL